MPELKAKANGVKVAVQHKLDSTATLKEKIDARKAIRIVKK